MDTKDKQQITFGIFEDNIDDAHNIYKAISLTEVAGNLKFIIYTHKKNFIDKYGNNLINVEIFPLIDLIEINIKSIELNTKYSKELLNKNIDFFIIDISFDFGIKKYRNEVGLYFFNYLKLKNDNLKYIILSAYSIFDYSSRYDFIDDNFITKVYYNGYEELQIPLKKIIKKYLQDEFKD